MQISKIGNFSNISYKGNETAPKKENFTSKINLKSEDSFVSKHKKGIKIGAAILTGTAAIAGAALLINKKGGSKAVEKVANEIVNNDEALNKAEKIQETVSEKLEPITLKTQWEVDHVYQPIVINIDEATGKPVYNDMLDAHNYLCISKILHNTGGEGRLGDLEYTLKDGALKGVDIRNRADTYLRRHAIVKQAVAENDQILQLRDKYYPNAGRLNYERFIEKGSKNRDDLDRWIKIGDDMRQFYDEKTRTFDETGLREFCKKL